MNSLVNNCIKYVIKGCMKEETQEMRSISYALIHSINHDIDYSDNIVTFCHDYPISNQEKYAKWLDAFPIDKSIRYCAIGMVHYLEGNSGKDDDNFWDNLRYYEDSLIHKMLKDYKSGKITEQRLVMSLSPFVGEGDTYQYIRYTIECSKPYSISSKDKDGRFDIELFTKHYKTNAAMAAATKIITIKDDLGAIVYQTKGLEP
jgi:hypothetical protein